MSDLRAVQAPIKQHFKEHPEAALVTLDAEGNLGEGVSCNVSTGRALVKAGLHEAAGGSGLQVCSGTMLLEALVACAGVTLAAVAEAIGIQIASGHLRAEGDLDFRGTLGIDKTVPVGFRAIRLIITLDCDADAEKRAKLLQLTERYCVVYQTLRGNLDVTARLEEPAETAARADA